MISDLTLTQAIEQRARLLEQINQDLNNINGQFDKDPGTIDTETTYKLINDLRQTNATIEKRKQENLNRDKFCCCIPKNGVKKTTYFVIGINATAWLSLFIFAIVDLTTNTSPQQMKKAVAEVAITVFALFLSSILAEGVKLIDDDNDRLQLLSRISRLEERGEENFQQFLLAFNSFRKSQAEKPETQKERLTQCIHTLDKLPCEGFKEKIPSRDQWISLLVEMLPENHPIKKKFLRLKAAALEIFEIEEAEQEIPSPSHESLEKNTENQNLHAQEDNYEKFTPSEETSTSNSTSSSPNSFSGERLGRPKIFSEDFDKIPAQLSGSSVQYYRRHSPLISSKHQYKKEWEELEGQIGTHISCVKIGSHCIDKQCHVADKLELLPSYHLSRSNPVSETNDAP